MGEAGEIEPETESFLIENEIDFAEFPPEVLECLPQEKPWSIPQVRELVHASAAATNGLLHGYYLTNDDCHAGGGGSKERFQERVHFLNRPRNC